MDRSSQRSAAARQASTWLVLLISCGGSDAPDPLRVLRLSSTGDDQYGMIDQAMSVHIVAAGGTHPFVWSRSGGVPGLALEDMERNEAFYRGVPTVPGSYSVTIRANDDEGLTGDKSYIFHIAAKLPPPSFVLESLPLAIAGTPYVADLGLRGGDPPFSWEIGESTPGLFVEGDGILGGTAPAAGDYLLEVSVTDDLERSAFAMWPLQAVEVLDIVTGRLPPATVNQPYRAELEATGGLPPYTWSGSLPAGFSFDGNAIVGTPTEVASHSLNIYVSDGSDQMIGRQLIIYVGS